MIKINSYNEIEFKDKALLRAENFFKSSEIVKQNVWWGKLCWVLGTEAEASNGWAEQFSEENLWTGESEASAMEGDLQCDREEERSGE